MSARQTGIEFCFSCSGDCLLLASSNQWWLFLMNYHFGIEMEHNFLTTKERINQCNRYNPPSLVPKRSVEKVLPTGHRHWSCFFLAKCVGRQERGPLFPTKIGPSLGCQVGEALFRNDAFCENLYFPCCSSGDNSNPCLRGARWKMSALHLDDEAAVALCY